MATSRPTLPPIIIPVFVLVCATLPFFIVIIFDVVIVVKDGKRQKVR